jgi:hypothetical protein
MLRRGLGTSGLSPISCRFLIGAQRTLVAVGIVNSAVPVFAFETIELTVRRLSHHDIQRLFNLKESQTVEGG